MLTCSSVGPIDVPWLLQLDFQPFHPDLETVHSLDRCLCRSWIVKADKAETFALISCSVNEHLGADNVAKWKKHLHQLSISKLLGKVVDEEVTAVRTGYGTANTWDRKGWEG